MENKGSLLKEIRLRYNLTQKQLAGIDIDRSTIAHVENGTLKCPLTEELAMKIAKNINLEIKNKGEYIDYMYFYDNKRYNLAIKAKAIITELEKLILTNSFNDFNIEFEKLTPIFLQHPLPELKVQAFELGGINAIKQGNYFKAHMLLTRAIDSAINMDNTKLVVNLSNQSAKSLIYLNKYTEALNIYKILLKSYIEVIDGKLLFAINYNTGHCLKQLCNYSEAITYFYKSIESLMPSEYTILSDVYSSVSICYSRQSEYDKAITVLNEALVKINHEPSCVLHIYLNLLSIYVKQQDNENVIKYINIVTTCLHTVESNNKYFAQAYIELGDAYTFINNIELSEITYIKALGIAKTNNDYLNQIRVVSNLLGIYVDSKVISKIEILVVDIFHIIRNTECSFNDQLVGKLIDAYADFNKCESIKILINTINQIRSDKNEKGTHNFAIDSSHDALRKYQANHTQNQ